MISSMRLLVLGGTVFLSKAVAAEAVRRGHEVTCACRGSSGPVPEGATHVEVDRDQPLPDELTSASYDAVVDVARIPSWVRAAVTAFPSAHWVFVSTINVYADETTPNGGPGRLPLREPITDDVDLAEEPEAYGPMKVACEQLVLDGVDSAMVVRPGLIVGPGDPTGRFTYWPRRLAAGGEVLAPGERIDLMQVIDVRDLAEWIVDASESRLAGVYDGIGPATPMLELLTEAAAGVEAECSFTWVNQTFLIEQGVEPWAGPDSVPLWLPRPDYDGMTAHDATPSLEAGMRIRPLSETTRDTVAWLQSTPGATVTGISLERERELLDVWHTQVTGRGGG